MEQAAVEVPRVEKKGKGRMVGILVALVLVLGAGAAGAVFAPRLLAKGPAPKAGEHDAAAAHEEEPAAEEHAEAEEEEAPKSKRRAGTGETVELNPIIVDSHQSDGTLRHLKIQLAVELGKDKPAEEFKKLQPYVREASIGYLRTQDFDKLSDPKNFDALRKDLQAEVFGAIGKTVVKRVLIVDFVVQ